MHTEISGPGHSSSLTAELHVSLKPFFVDHLGENEQEWAYIHTTG